MLLPARKPTDRARSEVAKGQSVHEVIQAVAGGGQQPMLTPSAYPEPVEGKLGADGANRPNVRRHSKLHGFLGLRR